MRAQELQTAVRRRRTRARVNSRAGLRSMRVQELKCVVGACMREYMRVSMQNANGSDGALKTMMAKLLSQKFHRAVHAVVGYQVPKGQLRTASLSQAL